MLELIAGEKVKIGEEEERIIQNTKKLQNESEEVEREIHSNILPSDEDVLQLHKFKSQKFDPLQLDRRNASMALQELCERNRNYASHKVQEVQGPLLEVRSIVPGHRFVRNFIFIQTTATSAVWPLATPLI